MLRGTMRRQLPIRSSTILPRPARAIVGRIIERGLSDEINDRHYLIVEATDGRSHYVDIGRGDNVGALGDGAIARIAPAEYGVRDVDRTVVNVAAANGGRYTIDARLRHDPAATQAFAGSACSQA